MKQQMPIRMHLFPRSLPDELFASRPSRYHWQIGGRQTKKTRNELFGEGSGRLTQIIPRFLWPLAERMPGNPVETARQLLQKNTLYPICSLFYGLDLVSLENFDGAALLQLPRRTFGLSDTRLCLSCLKDDFSEVGTPYLHRSHQIPGVRVCHRHAVPLLDECPRCGCPFENKTDLFYVPWRPCKCKRMLSSMKVQDEPLENDDPALEYARFSHELLMGASYSALPEEIAVTYRERLLQLGFAWGKRHVSQKAALQALEDYYGNAEMARIDLAYQKGLRDQWMRLIHPGLPKQEVPISRHLLLANFLFRSASDFMQAMANYRSPQPFGTAHTIRLDKKLPDRAKDSLQDQRIVRCLQKLAEAKEKNPHITLKDMWKRFPGTMERLLKWDVNAFEEMQRELTSSRQGAKEKEQKIIRPDESDGIKAEQLKQSATRLYATRLKPSRVSKAEMLRNAKLSVNHADERRFPLCAQTLEQYSESAWHFWARRYVWAFSQYGGAVGTSEILKLSGIHRYPYNEFIRFFADLKIPRSLREGQILALLGSYGIERKWAGPCPTQKIMGGGRSYQRKKSSSGIDAKNEVIPPVNNKKRAYPSASEVAVHSRKKNYLNK